MAIVTNDSVIFSANYSRFPLLVQDVSRRTTGQPATFFRTLNHVFHTMKQK